MGIVAWLLTAEACDGQVASSTHAIHIHGGRASFQRQKDGMLNRGGQSKAWAEAEQSGQSCILHFSLSLQRLHLPPCSRTPCMQPHTTLMGHQNIEPHPQAVQLGSEVLG